MAVDLVGSCPDMGFSKAWHAHYLHPQPYDPPPTQTPAELAPGIAPALTPHGQRAWGWGWQLGQTPEF